MPKYFISIFFPIGNQSSKENITNSYQFKIINQIEWKKYMKSKQTNNRKSSYQTLKQYKLNMEHNNNKLNVYNSTFSLVFDLPLLMLMLPSMIIRIYGWNDRQKWGIIINQLAITFVSFSLIFNTHAYPFCLQSIDCCAANEQSASRTWYVWTVFPFVHHEGPSWRTFYWYVWLWRLMKNIWTEELSIKTREKWKIKTRTEPATILNDANDWCVEKLCAQLNTNNKVSIFIYCIRMW